MLKAAAASFVSAQKRTAELKVAAVERASSAAGADGAPLSSSQSAAADFDAGSANAAAKTERSTAAGPADADAGSEETGDPWLKRPLGTKAAA